MGYPASNEARKYVEKLVKHNEGPWCLLLLPTGQWAAFWYQGIDGDQAELVFSREYERACAFIGNKEDTVEYILKDLLEHTRRNPRNYKFDIAKRRKSIFRSNSKLNKFSS